MLINITLLVCFAIASKDKAQDIKNSDSSFAKGFLLSKTTQNLKNAKQDASEKDSLLMFSQKDKIEQGISSPAEKNELAVVQDGLCHHCNKFCEKLMRCSACRAVSFCSTACQKHNWRTHKNFCKEQGKNLKKMTPCQKEPTEELLRQQISIRTKISNKFTVDQYENVKKELENIIERKAEFVVNDCRVTANALISIFTGNPASLTVAHTELFLQKAKYGNVEDLETTLFTKTAEKKLIKISFRNDNKFNSENHPMAQSIYYGNVWGHSPLEQMPLFIHDVLIEKLIINDEQKFVIYQSWGTGFSVHQWLDESTEELEDRFNREHFKIARMRFGNAKPLSEKEMREWVQLFKIIAEFTVNMKQKDYSDNLFQKMKNALETDTKKPYKFNYDDDFVEEFIPAVGKALREMLGWYYSAIIWQNDISFYIDTI